MKVKLSPTTGGLVEPLTKREREVLLLLAQHLRYQDIAERLTIAISSVKWFVQQVYGKLGVDNRRDALQRAQTLGLLDLPAEPAISSRPAPTHNLPLELTPFIGRQAEISEVVDLLRNHRLVTLTGSGGVGKTRLSIQVAGRLLDEMPNGVWYVELAPISDAELVPQAVATMLGLREDPNRPLIETMAYFFSKRELLLVLDNCEHLLQACARLVDAMLRKAPGLKIITSSREALGIAGEHAFRVPSLSIPDPHQSPSLLELQNCEAVQLFTERARAMQTGFAVDERNSPAIAAICQRLDGIPLALELAAVRLNLLTPEQLASRLDHAFRLLTGGSRAALPRQQTLRATIDWSYQLLSIQEQVLLRRMAIFAGGGTLEAIEAVCAGEGVEAEQVVDLLSGLVNKSMVNAGTSQRGAMRYRLLETVRQYSREKLYDSNEIEKLRNRHLEYFVEFCEEAFPPIHGAGRLEWVGRLKLEHDNIREALEWSINDPSLALQGLRIAADLTDRFWLPLGFSKVAFHWLNTGLQAAGDKIPKQLKAEVYYHLMFTAPNDDLNKEAYEKCVLLCREIRPEADRILCLVLTRFYSTNDAQNFINMEEGVRIARKLGQAGTWELGECLFYYSVRHYFHPTHAYDGQALAAAEESLQVHRTGDRWSVPGYWVLGIHQILNGQGKQARQTLETALKIFNEIEDYVGISLTLFLLAVLHRLAGRYPMSLHYCRELFKCANAVVDERGYRLFVYSIGILLVRYTNDSPEKEGILNGADAIKLVSFVSRSLEKPGEWIWYTLFETIDLQSLHLLRQRLDEEAFSSAWQEDRELSLEEAVALALSVKIEPEIV